MKKIMILFATVLLLSTSNLFAQSVIQNNMKLVPNSYIQKLSNEAVSLEPEDFMKAAFLASGVSEKSLTTYMNKVEKVYKDYEAYRVTKNTKLNDAEAGIVYLYDKKVLVEYETDQSSLAVLLDTGTYNCVSSAILYMYMMKRRGFKVIANETPDHVFCTVMDDKGKQTDVETTSIMGFAPGVVKKVNNSTTGKSGKGSMEQEYYENVKRISGRRLISMIYNNRLVIEQQNDKPNNQKIIQMVVDTTTLQLESKESIQEMYFNIGNVMYYLIQEGKYEDALYVANAFTDEYGHYGKSAYVTDRVASVFGLLYEQHDSNTDYFGYLIEEYGHCLSKETYSNFYEKWVYDKVVELVWNDDIPEAKKLLSKGMEKLGYTDALFELQTQLEEVETE